LLLCVVWQNKHISVSPVAFTVPGPLAVRLCLVFIIDWPFMMAGNHSKNIRIGIMSLFI
jgi:hypothetical protein